MRGKVAKALRRKSEDKTVGNKKVGYSQVKQGKHQHAVVLSPDCTRAVYKQLKKFNSI